ncbi:chaperone protein DNAj, putative [Entamoeba invadens IP1]|uniref:Chaperone protein DNAj, putative n=1 Tax=Entamoeba invadens IP1 TaxID=370355 RepID=A0A0A1TZ17_ENTIV|nr:chaperone protein DNAj, putative [Entamoeba invadens IP1]ELP84960.1 chaperone protein DNAj, putative [Entamoeba invadens IP1]|eukprot:XP_004184306.1 chaperone protein DNAj, putative [Entamoeba invadens IP1]
MADYYQILGVSPSATQKTIQKQYYLLAKQNHPDRNPNSTEFKTIAEAYSVLKDPHKRILYNLYGTNAIDMATYIDIPITQREMNAHTQKIVLLVFSVLFIIELIFRTPATVFGGLFSHILVAKQMPWKTIVVVVAVSAVYTTFQYFYHFETCVVDHGVLFAEIVLLCNTGRTVSWDASFLIFLSLIGVTYFSPVHTPIGLGSINIGIGSIVVASTFMRLCASDDTNSTFFKMTSKILFAVPDLQYGLLVLFAFWFFHGIIDTITGVSIEYITINLQFFPFSTQKVSMVISFITILFSLVVYQYIPHFCIYLLSTAIGHFLVTSFCINNVGPTIKKAISNKTTSKIRLGEFTQTNCWEVGPPQLSIEEICKDVTMKKQIEWETEKKDSRWKALVLVSVLTFSMEILFVGANTSLMYARCLIVGFGVNMALFGFGEMVQIRQKKNV